MYRKKTKHLLIAVVGALLLVLLPATSAQAAHTPVDPSIDGPHYWMYSNDSIPRGAVAEFWSVGDHSQVCDDHADGASVRMAAWESIGGNAVQAFTLSASGEGNCNHKDATDGAQYNLLEKCTMFAVWLVKDGEIVDGSIDYAEWDNDDNIKGNCNF